MVLVDLNTCTSHLGKPLHQISFPIPCGVTQRHNTVALVCKLSQMYINISVVSYSQVASPSQTVNYDSCPEIRRERYASIIRVREDRCLIFLVFLVFLRAIEEYQSQK